MEPFYVIWNPDSKLPITTKFKTLDQANKVALKMADETQDTTFHVLEVVYSYMVSPSNNLPVTE